MTIDEGGVKRLYEEATARRKDAWKNVERAWRRYERYMDRKRSYRERGPENIDSWSDFRRENNQKEGRPSIWRGLEGYFLVSEVEKIQAADKSCTVAKAIRRAIRTHLILKECKTVHRISDRALQARYQQAAEYWADAIRADLRKELERAREDFDEALRSEQSLGGLLEII